MATAIGMFRQPGGLITVKASKALAYHELITVGAIVAVTKASANNGEYVACDAEGVFQLPKKASEAITQGTKVYLDSDGVITATADSATYAGIAWTNEASESTTVDVKINV